MKLEVLLSCMNQNDISIVKKSKITGDVLIINQTSHASSEELCSSEQHIRMISTTERGLSNSRNMAIQNAKGDICLLSDDDEIFDENYEKTILEAFQKLPDADVIAFHVLNKTTRLKPMIQRLRYLNCLKIASYQIAFRKETILNAQISFDPFMGAGTGNGGGEENKFLFDCLKKGLRIYYIPTAIAAVQPQVSTWFFGYNENFFYQRGTATRYYMGNFFALIYASYYLFAKYPLYHKEISFWKATKSLLRGYLKNDIYYQKKNEKSSGFKLEKL